MNVSDDLSATNLHGFRVVSCLHFLAPCPPGQLRLMHGSFHGMQAQLMATL